MSVVADEDDETMPPMIMMLTQQDAWSPYKLTYAGEHGGVASSCPPLAPASIGAPRVPGGLVVPRDGAGGARRRRTPTC